MHYHLILTEVCNSRCRYCYEKSMKEFDNGLDKKFEFEVTPAKINFSIDKLKEFLDRDNEAVLIFYGGEPLLEIDKIKEIIDKINVKFRMQTNGKLLDRLPINYLKKINKILISLDGDEERTDFNRGKCTYKKVLENIQKIKEQGYEGELIARMTISFSDIYEQVLSLVKDGFESLHWQLDAGFYKFDFNEKEFSDFVEKYNLSISKLIDYWFEEIKKGNVLKFYPFLGIVNSFLSNEKSLLRCGAGHLGYCICTNGNVVACPIMNSIKNFQAGDLNDFPKDLKKFEIKGKCKNCDFFEVCGGRCLYWNYARLWPKKGDELICKTIKHLINELKIKVPEINRLISEGIVKKSDFEYEKYFGPEIIP
jgi:uncharacterized protein